MNYCQIFFIILITTILPLNALTLHLPEDQILLLLNRENHYRLPNHFRKTSDVWSAFHGIVPLAAGMDKLFASGSSQFAEDELRAMQSQLPPYFVIVDLREESHGFIDGNAVSWYANKNRGNSGKTTIAILNDEKNRLFQAAAAKTIVYHLDLDTTGCMRVNTIKTEEELAQEYGLGYFRLPVTDHLRPNDAKVDMFINFTKSLPPSTWLHFHCSAGWGRASTFMIMYDMMHNSKHLEFEDFIVRQKLLGGKDFWELPDPNSWKYEAMVDRVTFLKQFYLYTKTDQKLTWSQWLLENK